MKKFDYFVPCYYDLKKHRTLEGNESVELDTSEHYSEEYLQRAKEANPNILITPRIYVHGMQGDVFFLASTKEEEMDRTLSYFEEIYANPLYDGVFFSSPFITPNHQYPFSMKNFLKSVRAIADNHSKKLLIGMDGVDPKPDQKINKKKARELIHLADKVIIANYDCPRGNEGLSIPISPMDWIKQNYDFYCEVYSKSKITSKLIMVPIFLYAGHSSVWLLRGHVWKV